MDGALASNSIDVRIIIVAETNYQTYRALNFVANLIVIRTLDSLGWPFYMKYIIYVTIRKHHIVFA